MRAVVLGCTHYELVAERIRAAVQRPGRPPLVLHGSAGAVAAQALRRIGAAPDPAAPDAGTVTVLLAGEPGSLPATALTYAEGRLLAAVSPARYDERPAPDAFPRAAGPGDRRTPIRPRPCLRGGAPPVSGRPPRYGYAPSP